MLPFRRRTRNRSLYGDIVRRMEFYRQARYVAMFDAPTRFLLGLGYSRRRVATYERDLWDELRSDGP
jgi:hypothetical protein